MAVIKKNGNFMGIPMNIYRGNPIPIDTTEVWYSLESAENYAKNGATAYVGQKISVVDEENKTAKMYIIGNTDGDLLEVWATDTESGESTAEVTMAWGDLG